MRIALPYRAFENLGVEYLSAVLKASGHEVSFILDPSLFDDVMNKAPLLAKFFSYECAIKQALRDLNPDMVIFSVVAADYKWALAYSQFIKQTMDSIVVWGGIHPTSVPDRVLGLPCVDYIVVGEGEAALVELVETIEHGGDTSAVRSVFSEYPSDGVKAHCRPLITDINRLPFPDKDMYWKLGGPFRVGYVIIGTRGCENRCSYCHHSVLKKLYPKSGYLRKRDPENVIAELKWAKEKYAPKFIKFFDDDLLVDRSWIKELAVSYEREIGLPCTCIVHPTSVVEDVMPYMVKMKCQQMNIGFQSPCLELKRRVFHRNDTKADAAEAIRLCRKYKIKCIVDNIFNIPGETEAEMRESFEFYTQNVPTRIFMPWLKYYPNTDIYNAALKSGEIDGEMLEKIAADPECEMTMQSYATEKIAEHAKSYQLLFTALVLSKRLADWLYVNDRFKRVPLWSAFALNFVAYVTASIKYELTSVRVLYRYWHFMLKKIARRPLKIT